MKKSELIQAIKEALLPEIETIVTKRVAAAAKKIIQEQKKNKPLVAKHETPSLGSLMSEEKNPYEVQAKKTYTKKEFTKNGMLNDILNETAQQAQEWKTMNAGEYTSDMAQNFRAANPMEAFNPGPPTAQQMVPEDRQGRPIPDAVANALTKDYSALVKSAAFKKRGA
jgi:hypothetical protein